MNASTMLSVNGNSTNDINSRPFVQSPVEEL